VNRFIVAVIILGLVLVPALLPVPAGAQKEVPGQIKPNTDKVAPGVKPPHAGSRAGSPAAVPPIPGAPRRLELSRPEDHNPNEFAEQGKLVVLSWTRPDHGLPADHYVVESIRLRGSFPDTTLFPAVPDTFLELVVEHGKVYRLRVAAVDSLGRRGEFGELTPVYGTRVRIED